MLANAIKTTVRIFRKNWTFTLINIFSLTLGLTAGIFILIYVLSEFSFDNFHEKEYRIYRVLTTMESTRSGNVDYYQANAWPVGQIFRDEFPEVEKVVYYRNGSFMHVNHGESRVYQRTEFFGPEFFGIFSFDMLKGDPETALTEPYTLVLTKSMEEKFFDGQDALGKSLLLGDSLSFKVTGVVADVPDNSHIQFDLLLSFATYEALDDSFSYGDGWSNINIKNYLLLREGVNPEAFTAKAANLYRERVPEMLQSWGMDIGISMEPLKDIYLKSKAGNSFGPKGSMERIYLVLGICLFTILLACINFINLSTAKSLNRSKEVGLRKAIGSSRISLIVQFMGEALLLTLAALALSLVLVYLLMPLFNELLGKSYSMNQFLNPLLLIGILGITLIIALLAGYYPALKLSSFKPTEVLKGRFVSGQKGVSLRKSLVVFQFSVSVSLVLGTFIVLDQLHFMQNKELGFNKDGLIVLSLGQVPSSTLTSFKNELTRIPGVAEVSQTNSVPGRIGWLGQIAYPEGKEEEIQASVEYAAIDENYLEVLGLELVAGRNFDAARKTDLSEGLVINESAVKAFGWNSPEEAIGKKIVSPSTTPQGEVIGVIRDFHQLGLQHAIHPVVFDVASPYWTMMAVRIPSGNSQTVIADLEQLWTSFYAGYDFSFFYLDRNFEQQYMSEVRLSKLFILFAVTTILISLIGLLGLVSFLVKSKTKEIGVRKVLGAGEIDIVKMISGEFLVLVILASCIAVPLVSYAAASWLQSFAYKMELGVGIFILTVVIALLLTLLTVGIHALKASLADPVKSLKSD